MVSICARSVCTTSGARSPSSRRQPRYSRCVHDQKLLLTAQGTLRDNLDPFHEHDDRRLNDALRRAHLLEAPVPIKAGEVIEHDKPRSRFSLDVQIDANGENFSIGERSLVSLARALVVDAQIVFLDGAFAFGESFARCRRAAVPLGFCR